jgi:isoamylase
VLGAALLAGCPSEGSHVNDDDASVSDAAGPFAPGLGATFEPGGGGVWFRLAAPRATHVELWIYAAPTGAEALRVVLERDADRVWSARVATDDLRAAGVDTIYYGYRVWGPTWTYDAAWTPGSELGFVTRVDGDGNRMNPNKLLVDPYARELSHDPTGPVNPDGSIFRTDEAYRAVDSGPLGPKGIALRDEPADVGPRPERALADDVIYEVHLRGLTAADAGTDPCAGTYAAAAARAGELADLGVTAIELLPVQETTNDRNDVDPTSADGDNYWGYSTLGWFAPDRRYACDRSPGGPTREFQAMVRAFHARGLKVFIDVVYNHTAEGGGGSLLSWRGIDNAEYYLLDNAGTGFTDQTGIGASTNATSPVFQQLVLDSLAYWNATLGVDGYRFDLASVLGNGCERGCFRWEPDGSVLARAVTELPARPVDGGSGVDLVAEPWGVAAGTYRVGEFPAGWSEWNDKYRDTMRSDQNQLGVAPVTLGWIANRVAGSPELFGGRGPSASINFLVAHDGFTLADLYHCNGKNNDQAWPYGPSNGGTDDNRSWDQGGDASRQRQAARTGLGILLLSTGVPMIVGGDEELRGQRCNNNPYNLDSVGTWHDPADRIEHAAFRTFASRLLAFRAAHPALRRRAPHDLETIRWYRANGAAAEGGFMDDPNQQFLAWRYDGAPAGDPAASILVAYNGGTSAVAYTLPAHAATTAWFRVADTGAWLEDESNIEMPGDEYRMMGNRYDLAPRSLVLFVERAPE